jgi:hypothetical protein
MSLSDLISGQPPPRFIEEERPGEQ